MIKDFLIITIGVVITAFGLVLFMIPYNIIAGGVSGLAIIFNHFFGWWVGLQMLVYNLILFYLSFKLLGTGLGVKSVYSAILLSLVTDLLQQGFKLDQLIPNLIEKSGSSTVEITLLSAFYGGLITGFGMGLVIWKGSTTGGTDIIAMILNKVFSISVGTGLMITDTIITASSIFINPLLPMYGVMAIFITAKTIDGVLEGFESTRTVLIISDYYEDIKNDIFRELNRGVTYLNGVGTYSEQEKVVLMVVLSRNEIGPLKKIIDNRDKEAFMVILPNTEAIGYGFKRMS
ncbi:MAG TPA: YitT family protein [Defluviitoga sp.]|nr:YitT family protein [Defluviitoga sp.]HOP24216.1 YitT family protein [Defluviitoga sp.]HPZ28192.1 YitT family protein [Defluviitoga sp.]HQD62082.1 YitT family protein [Defluviitoga sp.]